MPTSPEAFAAMLAESCCVNSDANLAKDSEKGVVDHIGSKTECALLQLVEDLRAAGVGGLAASDCFAYVGNREAHEVAQRYHFTSARKRMSTAIARPGGVGTRLLVSGTEDTAATRADAVVASLAEAVDWLARRSA